MNTWICKATLAAAVACLTLMAVSPAQAAACWNASLRGRYAQTISGEILPGPGIVQPQNGVAITNFDGQGTFTQEDFVVIGGTPVSLGFATGETGTYTVNSDCTGTATINYPDGSWIDLELVVIDQGNEFRTVVSVLNLRGTTLPANIASSGQRLEN
ncbi:MAG: hypothetical protein ABR880_22160 [Candidatus Sulfotelmatobacter sp.]|jgi:hypothetical protein